MEQLATDIVLTVEFALNVSGAGAVAPTNPKLFVVRAGNTEAEIVAGAVFTQVSGPVFETVLPASFVDRIGIYSVFAVSDEAKSVSANIVQVGEAQNTGVGCFIPFTGRDALRRPVSNLINTDVTLNVLSVDLPLVSRSVDVDEFVQLEDALANPQPFYLVKIRDEEVAGEGSIAYSVTAATIIAYSSAFSIDAAVFKDILFKTEPFQPNVLLEILKDSVVYAVGRTDTAGEAIINLPNGSYVLRLSKPGFVFTANNVPVEITDETLDFVAVNGAFTVPTSAGADFCKITFRLLNPDGTPLTGIKVVFAPQLLAVGGAGIMKTGFSIQTNADGRGEVNLVQGLVVTVTVEGTRVYETFTVPALTTVDLFSLITFQDKGFEYYVPHLENSIRRSLIP